MDRFLKHTEHPVSPVLPAPKKPNVSSKQGVISASFRAQEYIFMKAEANFLLQKLQLGY